MIMLKSTHLLELEIKRMVIDNLKNDIERMRASLKHWREIALKQGSVISSQQETISQLASDLVIVRGATRVRDERTSQQKVDPLLRPDVEVADEQSVKMTRDQREKAVTDAKVAYDRMIAELRDQYGDNPEVSPEALAAATPASVDDWKKEHSEGDQENL